MIIGGVDGARCLRSLLEWRCCPRCALRYIGFENNAIYARPQHEVHAQICEMAEKANKQAAERGDTESAVSVGDFNDSLCVACLGILQGRFCSAEFIDEIVEKHRAEGYDSSTFTVNLSSPLTLSLRHHALILSLRQLHPELFSPDMAGNVVTVKEVWRAINLTKLSAALGCRYDKESGCKVELTFEHENSQKECKFLLDLFPNTFRRRRNGGEVFNRSNVHPVLKRLSDEEFMKNYKSPPGALTALCNCDITFSQDSIFIAGRYNKYDRQLSQTLWIIDGERKTETSIEELICKPLLNRVRADKFIFTSSGREDVDVKMLGTGTEIDYIDYSALSLNKTVSAEPPPRAIIQPPVQGVCTQQQRKDYLHTQCDVNNVATITDYSRLYYVKPNAQFLVDPKHEIIYCQVSKDACSTWKGVMISSLLGDKIQKLSDSKVHARHYLESLGIRYATKWLPAYKNYTRFMVTRHPLDRLMSGYKNMIQSPPRSVGPSYAYNKWINQQLHGTAKQNQVASFEDFLNLVSSQEATIKKTMFYNDRHWLPISQVCQPCSVRYDYLVRLETAEHDATPILKLFHINDSLPHKNDGKRGDSHEQLGVGQSYLHEYATIPQRILKNIYERYALDFALYGYSYEEMENELRCSIDLDSGETCC